jgi:hypothetical protein
MVAVGLQVAGTESLAGNGGLRVPSAGDSIEFSALFLTFDSIRVYVAGAQCDSSGQGWHGGSGDPEYIEILVDPVTVDAVELDSTLTALLGSAELPTGTYSHLSLGIVEAWAITPEGEEVEVIVPGTGDPSLRVMVSFTVEEGQVSAITIVVNLERSLREMPPGSGRIVLMPVLRGESTGGGHGQGWHHQHGDQGHQNHRDHPGEWHHPGDHHGDPLGGQQTGEHHGEESGNGHNPGDPQHGGPGSGGHHGGDHTGGGRRG